MLPPSKCFYPFLAKGPDFRILKTGILHELQFEHCENCAVKRSKKPNLCKISNG